MGLALRRKNVELNFDLHPKQDIAFYTEATEVLYGGAAGGGKSHLMRSAAIAWCVAIPGLQVYLFRRVHVDLIKNHMEGPKGFRAMLAEWVNEGLCKIVDDNEIRFGNGSRIYLCHCKDAKDVYKYQGAEIHVLLIDEITHFLEDMYRFLRNRVRMVGLKIPPQLEGRFPRILLSGNPGNIGHLWVKETFIANRIPLTVTQEPDEEGGMRRQYIPARIDDNPSLTVDDPGYMARLAGLGSPALVKAMRDGDWDVVEGAFFSEWSNVRHVIEPFAVPAAWLRFRSVDWGFARPFSVGWWAVVSDDFTYRGGDGVFRTLPRGALVRYREWYGCVPKKANTGLRLTAEAVAKGILDRSLPDVTEDGRPIEYAYTVLDPSMFDQDGGPSIAERFIATKLTGLRRGDNKRTTQVGSSGQMGGWDLMRSRLRGEGWTEDGPGPNWRPDIYCFVTCTHSIRTIPVLQHDPDKPEDLDTEGEDHAADDWRYAVKSRPYIARVLETPPPQQNLIYEAVRNEDGTITTRSNKSIMQIVEERLARKKGRRS